MTFTHLQVISTNSLMKSTLTIEELVVQAKNQGHEAIALTDQNIMYGAIEFYEAAIKHELKPIIGLTLDVQGVHSSNESFPLVLLAKNYAGYQELIQLSTMYHLAEDEAIPLAEIILRSTHLFVISPSIEGEITSLLGIQRVAEAREVAQYFHENLQDFYLGISLQPEDSAIYSFYQDTNIPVVALGNVQYLAEEDAMPTKVLQVLEAKMPLGDDGQAAIIIF